MSHDPRRPSEAVDASSGSGRRAALRVLLGLILLFVVSLLVGRSFRSELEHAATWFVREAGLPGMALGTWLADGFLFPVPPQFYMLLAIAGETSATAAFLAIVLGSLGGGASGYLLAPRLVRRLRFVRTALARSEERVRRLSRQGWFRSAVLLSLTPIAFSWLCYAAGMYKAPRSAFLLLCALRVPKLLVYQLLIVMGWQAGFASRSCGWPERRAYALHSESHDPQRTTKPVSLVRWPGPPRLPTTGRVSTVRGRCDGRNAYGGQ